MAGYQDYLPFTHAEKSSKVSETTPIAKPATLSGSIVLTMGRRDSRVLSFGYCVDGQYVLENNAVAPPGTLPHLSSFGLVPDLVPSCAQMRPAARFAPEPYGLHAYLKTLNSITKL